MKYLHDKDAFLDSCLWRQYKQIIETKRELKPLDFVEVNIRLTVSTQLSFFVVTLKMVLVAILKY